LEEYLQQGQWKAADEETYRLMITAVGKEEGQGFSRDELLNFPCDELLAIDGLWVRYSNGKFGFSVQKALYLNQCGGVADGEYYLALSNFYRMVDWLSIKYDINQPNGHLPSLIRGGAGGVVEAWRWERAFREKGVWSLLSHPDL
jgi:hypothetical protein